MQTYSQDQFNLLLKNNIQQDGSVNIRGPFKVHGFIEIHDLDLVKIKDVQFDSIKCSNNHGVQLVNVHCKNLDVGDELEHSHKVTIHGGQFASVSINADTVIEIEQKAIITDLYISNIFPKHFNVNSRQIENIYFTDISPLSNDPSSWPDLYLLKNRFKSVKLSNTYFKSLGIYASDLISISDSVIVTSQRCTAPNYEIKTSEFREGILDLYHSTTDIKNKIEISSLHVKILNLNKYNGSCRITNLITTIANFHDTKNVHLHQCRIEKLSFAGSWIEQKKGSCADLYNLEISNSDLNTVSRIEGITFNRFIILNTLITNGIILHANKIINKFQLLNLALEKSYFNNIDLSNCQDIDFKFTLFKDCHFNSIEWPSGYLFHRKDTNDLKPHIESYRQIKKVYEDQNNALEASRFKRSELEIHRNYLKSKWCQKRWYIFSNNFLDWMIISTYKYFGGYGLKLTNVIFWGLFFHTLLFLGFYVNNTELFNFHPLWISTFNAEATAAAISNFIYFANPVHSFKYDTQYGTHQILSIWDALMRVSSAFFLFYFLKITRKFSQM